MKKCPNCGACQECGHSPSRPLPWHGPTWVYPYWSVVPYTSYPNYTAPQPTTWGGFTTGGNTSQ